MIGFIEQYTMGLIDSESDEMHQTVELMNKMGGSFVKAIAEAWYHGDPFNKRKLVKAFEDYFGDYHQKMKEYEKAKTI